MIEFQEEELTRNDICWGDSDDNLYIFNKDGKGKIFHDIDNTKDAFNLAWKINKSGILIIKSMVDKETYYFKIIKQESDYFECEKYIKNEDSEFDKVSDVTFTFLTINEDINELNDVISIEYTKKDKIAIGSTLFFIFLITYILQSFIPILSNTPFWLKLMISTMVVTFSFKNIIYLCNKLIINNNTRNKDE